VFLDELLLRNPGAVKQIARLKKECGNLYTQSVLKYQIPENPVGIENVHMLMRPWASLNGYNNSFIYSPLGSNQTFNLLRQLDFSTVSAETIADAQVARALVGQNANWLSKYITTESLSENDTYRDLTFSRDGINPRVLTIPKLPGHNLKGVQYLKNHITADSIGTNVIIALKTLHYLYLYFDVDSK
jgi:hypothetical protein